MFNPFSIYWLFCIFCGSVALLVVAMEVRLTLHERRMKKYRSDWTR